MLRKLRICSCLEIRMQDRTTTINTGNISLKGRNSSHIWEEPQNIKTAFMKKIRTDLTHVTPAHHSARNLLPAHTFRNLHPPVPLGLISGDTRGERWEARPLTSHFSFSFLQRHWSVMSPNPYWRYHEALGLWQDAPTCRRQTPQLPWGRYTSWGSGGGQMSGSREGERRQRWWKSCAICR